MNFYLASLLTEFEWRTQERRLNEFSQFTTRKEDIDPHFIHKRSSNPDALPLRIVHGWPDSIAEFQHIIGPLSDPVAHKGGANDAFHVIAPTLPGFGFSGKPTQLGYNPEKSPSSWPH